MEEIKIEKLKIISDPEKVLKNAKKYLGDDVVLDISTRKDKKYMVFNPESEKWVHFGQMNYYDFTRHNNLDRRNRYLNRAMNIKGKWKEDKYSPNNLSIHLLW